MKSARPNAASPQESTELPRPSKPPEVDVFPGLPVIPDLPEPPAMPTLLTQPVRQPKTQNILGMGERDKGKEQRKNVSDLGRAWGVAMDFIFTIVAGFLVGFGIDSYFKTMPLWSLVLMAFGFVYAMWRIIRRSMEDEKKEKLSKLSNMSK